MAKKRRSKYGIEPLSSGSFRVTISKGYSEGKQLRVRRTFGTYEEAKSWKMRNEDAVIGDWGNKPLRSWIDQWLLLRSSEIEPATLQWYGRQLKNLPPILMETKLHDLEPIRLASEIGEIRKRNPRLAFRVLKSLRSVLKEAVRLRQIPSNPAELVRGTTVPAAKVVPWDHEETARFLQHARFHRLYPLFLLALDSGARFGELTALKWKDIDNGKIFIHSSMEEIAGKFRVKQPKTAAGERTVLITNQSMQALAEHRHAMKAKKRPAGEDDFVFRNVRGHNLARGVTGGQVFRKLARQAGVREIRFHDLRHTSATLLLSAGISIKVVSERLGHKDIAITLSTYAHALPKDHDAAKSAMEAILTNKPKTNPQNGNSG